jgi:hypothetical protein
MPPPSDAGTPDAEDGGDAGDAGPDDAGNLGVKAPDPLAQGCSHGGAAPGWLTLLAAWATLRRKRR